MPVPSRLVVKRGGSLRDPHLECISGSRSVDHQDGKDDEDQVIHNGERLSTPDWKTKVWISAATKAVRTVAVNGNTGIRALGEGYASETKPSPQPRPIPAADPIVHFALSGDLVVSGMELSLTGRRL